MSPSTWKQQEERLVQCFPAFYLTQLGHTPEQAVCRIANNQIVITVEGAMSQIEKLLKANDQTSLVHSLRASLDQVLRTRLDRWLTELLQTEVIDLFVNTDIAQDRMMVIAILSESEEPELDDRSEAT